MRIISTRYTSNSSAYAARRKLRGSTRGGGGGNSRMVLPTKFLLGGNINDPLNLNSLCDEAINQSLNAPTPVPSPTTRSTQAAMLDPPLEVIRPLNIRDPLNLSGVEGGDAGGLGGALMKVGGRSLKEMKAVRRLMRLPFGSRAGSKGGGAGGGQQLHQDVIKQYNRRVRARIWLELLKLSISFSGEKCSVKFCSWRI